MSKIIKEQKDGVLFVIVAQERLVDDLNLQDVQREILEILEQEEPEPKLVLDLRRVAFVGSAALGMLVRFRKRRGEQGFSLKLCQVSNAVDETFRITGLNTLFEVYKTQKDAIESFDRA